MSSKKGSVKWRVALGGSLLLIGLAAALLWRQMTPPPVREHYPFGAQLLTYPLDDGLITAGYRNPRYLEKNNFIHYGVDLTPHDGKRADVLSLGTGVVLGVERCENNLGGIVVMRYDQVYHPARKTVETYIARYYHLLSVSVKEGDVLLPEQVIGTIDGQHEWYNHIHLELDTDLAHPFHTPQVAERSSELLIRYPASGQTIVEPLSVLAVGAEQRAKVHPFSDCCEEKDVPVFYAREFAPSVASS